VRVGLHTGTPLVAEEGYVGDDVHFAARVAATSHGGQVVVSAATAELVEYELTDLGEHRLKDIEESVPLFQLGDGSFPPLKTISNTNLPTPASSFLGREQELSEVLSRIEAGARLLTLTGPGGTGKTRLAIEAAATLVPAYKAGVFWVGLASLRDPALVTETIAQTLGAKHGLAEHIAERELLLLLDNLEQVIDAAPELSKLLQTCPNLTLLVTSRELLRVRGEVEYPVPPLAEPEAVRLFCERSQLEPSDEIAELCARLDSLPLAVELAAARTKALSPAQIAERLSQRLDLLKGGRDADPRQQTLRATIEWSYDLLTPAEQQLFARLSVFAGGCTLDAAEEVCDADLDTLQSLVEKSLLRFSDERYWMLETIREYAEGQVERAGEAAATRERHARYFLELAERIGGWHVFRGDQAVALEGLALELVNFRAAIEWSLEREAYEMVHRFGGALWFFWSVRGHFAEGRRLLEVAVTRSDPTLESWVWGALALGELDRDHGDFERARRLKEQVVPLLRGRGEPRALAGTLADLGDLAIRDGDYERARSLLEESLELRDHPDAARGRSRTLQSLALLSIREGDIDRAEQLSEEALERSMDVDPRSAHTGWALGVVGDVRRLRNDPQRAGHAYRASLQIMHALGNALGAADCLDDLAAIALARDDPERAGRLVGAAETLRLEASGSNARPEALPIEVPERAREEGAALTFDEAVEYALASLD
jgi:predicted ATPase